MKPEDLAAKLRFIKRVEARMKQHVVGAYFCMALAVGLICLDVDIYTTEVQPFAGRALVVGQVPLVGWALVFLLGIMASTMIVMLVQFWHNADKGRERLIQLRAITSAMSSEEQPEVWPPPPGRQWEQHKLAKRATD